MIEDTLHQIREALKKSIQYNDRYEVSFDGDLPEIVRDNIPKFQAFMSVEAKKDGKTRRALIVMVPEIFNPRISEPHTLTYQDLYGLFTSSSHFQYPIFPVLNKNSNLYDDFTDEDHHKPIMLRHNLVLELMREVSTCAGRKENEINFFNPESGVLEVFTIGDLEALTETQIIPGKANQGYLIESVKTFPSFRLHHNGQPNRWNSFYRNGEIAAHYSPIHVARATKVKN